MAAQLYIIAVFKGHVVAGKDAVGRERIGKIESIRLGDSPTKEINYILIMPRPGEESRENPRSLPLDPQEPKRCLKPRRYGTDVMTFSNHPPQAAARSAGFSLQV